MLKTNKQQPKKQVNKKHSTLRECVWGVCVCVRVCVLDREGTWVYSFVSTAIVVVNTNSFVSDHLQWLCDQFLWPIVATL